MKSNLYLFLFSVLFLQACAGGAPKKVTQGIDYARRPGPEVYYEFTSPIPLDPSQPSLALPGEAAGETPAEDEDFTSQQLTSSYSTYGDVVATAATRKFKLGEKATRKEMSVFMKSLETAYAKALRVYRPSGFTYAISSVGPVNSISDIEVSCRMSERSANEVGQAACTLFFNEIRTNYLRAMQEVK